MNLGKSNRLRFVTKVEGSYDAVLISGTLQYVPEPFSLLAGLDTNVLIVKNIPVIDCAASYVAIQHARTGTHPIWIFSRNEIDTYFQAHFAQTVEVCDSDGIILGIRSVRNTSFICRQRQERTA